jgi:hypothetical protein
MRMAEGEKPARLARGAHFLSSLGALALASPDFVRWSRARRISIHDALSFPDGKAVRLCLSEVQHARVPQLPVIPRESVDGHAEKTVIMAVDPELTA